VFNTSRQVGGALAVAVFGALLAGRWGPARGVALSLVIAALIALGAAATALLVRLASSETESGGT
jgi:sugar phosphate permease